MEIVRPNTGDSNNPLSWIADRSCEHGCGVQYKNVDFTADLSTCSPPGPWILAVDGSSISMPCVTPDCEIPVTLYRDFPEEAGPAI